MDETASRRLDGAAPWTQADLLDYLADLNEQCLELIAEHLMARAPFAQSFGHELTDLWRNLDEGARRRLAACPYLLLDVGFADSWRWHRASASVVADREPVQFTSLFSGPQAAIVGRQVFLYAWYLARTRPIIARMLLGAPAHCVRLIGACTLRQIFELAERHPGWLRMRWLDRLPVWRELLTSAISGEGAAIERARMHGLQLLAGDLRVAALGIGGEMQTGTSSARAARPGS
ncbi:MAG TPA: hypothetical protein VJQ47_07885 [Steroidobacteraceae bacterium]|nr:hypothetical protein [Steroidobacteraceae bacterium]